MVGDLGIEPSVRLREGVTVSRKSRIDVSR
jgi:hypothetical protein